MTWMTSLQTDTLCYRYILCLCIWTIKAIDHILQPYCIFHSVDNTHFSHKSYNISIVAAGLREEFNFPDILLSRWAASSHPVFSRFKHGPMRKKYPFGYYCIHSNTGLWNNVRSDRRRNSVISSVGKL
jgi:hypothetical protein